MYAVRYTTQLLFSHVWPANQPSIAGMALCRNLLVVQVLNVTRRDPILTSIHIAARGQQLTCSVFRRVFYLSLSINSLSILFTVEFRLSLLGVEVDVQGGSNMTGTDCK